MAIRAIHLYPRMRPRLRLVNNMEHTQEKPIATLLIEDNPGDARLIREQLAENRDVQIDLE
jgi:hypothetical protein